MVLQMPRPEAPQPEPDHDEQVRIRFRHQVARMLDDHGLDYAANLVRSERTDGLWP